MNTPPTLPISGTQAVGKSMVLNLIAQNVPINDLCAQILNSHEVVNEPTFEANNPTPIESQMENLSFADVQEKKVQEDRNIFKFKMEDLEQIERGFHCTKGNFSRIICHRAH